jgi:hypothetical protein
MKDVFSLMRYGDIANASNTSKFCLAKKQRVFNIYNEKTAQLYKKEQ